MGFDLYASDKHECINHHEEFLFALVEANPARYPQLHGLWTRFYDSPRLSHEQAGAVVHELLELLAANGAASNKQLRNLVLRLLFFFSFSYRERVELRCVSD